MRLFLNEAMTIEILHSAKGNRNVRIKMRKLPGHRACEESQLSYNRIKYAVSRGETSGVMP